MIHSGVKYLGLFGKSNDSAQELKAMPRIWRGCLAGETDLDEGQIKLEGVEVLSKVQHLWSPPGFFNRIAAGFSRRGLRGNAKAINRSEFPEPFDHSKYDGQVAEIDEPVLNPRSITEALTKGIEDCVYRVDNPEFLVESGRLIGVRIGNQTIRARRWVLAAGAGNGAIVERIGIAEIRMQRRPLHQIVIRSEKLPPMFSVCLPSWVNCLKAIPKRALPKPVVVITTHEDSQGRRLWYVGGDLAETSGRSEGEQVEIAKSRFQQLLPWVDFSGAEWSAFKIDRAEPEAGGKERPSGAFCETHENVSVAWPTKLALIPDLAKKLLSEISRAGLTPQNPQPELELPRPAIGRSPWDS